MDELIDRLRDRFNSYWHSEKRSIKLISRSLAFTLFAAVLSTIAPTLADELASDPTMLEPAPVASATTSTLIIEETVTATPSPSSSFTPEPEISRPPIAVPLEAPFTESSETSTAELPGVPLETQTAYSIKAPATVAVDPRAMTRYLPQIYLSNPNPEIEYTMACVSGAGLRFDAKEKQVANNRVEGSELISGDLSGQLLISASTSRVREMLNSFQGLFISSTGGGIAGRSLTLRLVAVSKPVADPAFCSYARSGAVVAIRPLALEQSTVKGGGRLK